MKHLLLLVMIAAAVGACDPIHANAKAALGGETPGVPPGPLHRPGQPCLVCHDGGAGDASPLSMAGTVFVGGNGAAPMAGVTLTLQNADGTTVLATTNEAGNFYFTPEAYVPGYPVHVTSMSSGDTTFTAPMHSHIGRNGSCAGCHFNPAGPDSPGQVYFQIVGPSP
jgi:hypothetical protein